MDAMKRDVLGSLKAKKAAVRYGQPSKHLRLVMVSGEGATTTARVLAEIFRECSKKVAVFTPVDSDIETVPWLTGYKESADDVHRALAAARKQRCEIAVMVMDRELEQTAALGSLNIDMAVITDQGSTSKLLLEQPLRYVVMPSGQTTELDTVAPHHAITYGQDHSADARIESVKLYRRGTEINLIIDHQTKVELATYLVGRSNATRVTAAVAAAYVMGAPIEQLADGVARLEELPGNYQYIDYEVPYKIAVDKASSTSAVEQLIDSARELTRRRLLIVCDQSVDPEALAAIKPKVDRLIVVKGHNGMATDQANSLTDAVELALRGAKLDDLVLLVGEELAEKVDEEQTRAARLVRGGSE